MKAADGRLVAVGQNLAQKRQASWADAARLIAGPQVAPVLFRRDCGQDLFFCWGKAPPLMRLREAHQKENRRRGHGNSNSIISAFFANVRVTTQSSVPDALMITSGLVGRSRKRVL
jgi:hypothetical protein